MTRRFHRLFGLGLLIVISGLAFTSVHAEDDKSPDGQKPPAVVEEPVKQEPENPKACVTENSGFRRLNGVNQFYVDLTNSCDKPHVCVLKAYVVGAEGGKAGRGTVQVPAASKGHTAHQTWIMRIASNGGMATMAHSCKPR